MKGERLDANCAQVAGIYEIMDYVWVCVRAHKKYVRQEQQMNVHRREKVGIEKVCKKSISNLHYVQYVLNTLTEMDQLLLEGMMRSEQWKMNKFSQ
jgi:hypothetical protein